MKLLALIIFATLTLTASSQEVNAAYAELTSKVIADISKDWKKDSIGKNGYRSQVFARLLRNGLTLACSSIYPVLYIPQ